MKISTTFIFNVATAVAALLALATPAHTAALPGSSAPRVATMPQPAPLEKRQLSGVNNFDLTYGRYKNIPLVAGIGPVEDSAQEIGTFADQILSHYNVTQLDYVGHSQGGILGRYWLKYLGGAGKVNRMVGISPINHGTTLDGIATIAQALRIFYPAQPIFDSFAPAFYELVNTSEFMAKLNLGGDVGANVIHSNIATRFDEVVTPYQTCYQNDAGVTNTLLQDLCIFSINEHLTMINSKVVLRWVMNQLDPANAKTSNCFAGLYL